MTEIYSGAFNRMYGDKKPKVGPKDSYHEPYPGYFAKQAKAEVQAAQVKQAPPT